MSDSSVPDGLSVMSDKIDPDISEKRSLEIEEDDPLAELARIVAGIPEDDHAQAGEIEQQEEASQSQSADLGQTNTAEPRSSENIFEELSASLEKVQVEEEPMAASEAPNIQAGSTEPSGNPEGLAELLNDASPETADSNYEQQTLEAELHSSAASTEDDPIDMFPPNSRAEEPVSGSDDFEDDLINILKDQTGASTLASDEKDFFLGATASSISNSQPSMEQSYSDFPVESPPENTAGLNDLNNLEAELTRLDTDIRNDMRQEKAPVLEKADSDAYGSGHNLSVEAEKTLQDEFATEFEQMISNSQAQREAMLQERLTDLQSSQTEFDADSSPHQETFS